MRKPPEIKAKATDLPDAVVAQRTTYATTFRRLGGFTLDVLVWLVCSFAVLSVAYSVLPDEDGDVFVSMVFVCVALGWLSTTLQISSKRQATLGMRAVGTFITDLHGQRLSLGRAFAWCGWRLLFSVFYGIGSVTQPFTKKRQTFHDMLAKTVVLRRLPSESKAPAQLDLRAALPG